MGPNWAASVRMTSARDLVAVIIRRVEMTIATITLFLSECPSDGTADRGAVRPVWPPQHGGSPARHADPVAGLRRVLRGRPRARRHSGDALSNTNEDLLPLLSTCLPCPPCLHHPPAW